MTNRKLREALLAKLGVTSQALSLRVQKIKEIHPVTTEDATYIIAQREGIKLDKYLRSDAVDRVRQLMRDISPSMPTQTAKFMRQKKSKSTDHRVIYVSKEFKAIDPILPAKRLLEAKEMAAIYPLLYVLENSIREVIDRVMISKYGDDWFDNHAPKKAKDTYETRTKEDEYNLWHQRRGARPIDYLDLKQLPPIIKKMESDFIPDILPSFEWFSQLVEEVYKSRCVVCHMNPLDKDNIDSVKVRVRHWQKQIRGINKA